MLLARCSALILMALRTSNLEDLDGDDDNARN